MLKLLLPLFCAFVLHASPVSVTDDNSTSIDISKQTVLQADRAEDQMADEHVNELEKNETIKALLKKKDALDKALKNDNIWSKIYSNYHTYIELKKQKSDLDDKISTLRNKYPRSERDEKSMEILENRKAILEGKLQLLKEYEKNPFKKFLTPPEIQEVPVVSNPVAVITALSYLKKLRSDQSNYSSRYQSIHHVMEKLQEREVLLKKLLLLVGDNEAYKKELRYTHAQIKIFEPVVEIFKTTLNVYTKKIDEIQLNLQADIKKEIEKASIIGGVILFFLLFTLLLKFLIRKYMTDNDRTYTLNKALNFFFFTVLALVLLFAYIENVSYMVTILGFASAGIAIAMKDWFMSLLGWVVIMVGGAIHVGDRVKFVREGVEYVGDIVDISLLRMTIQEDITLTTYMHNRRAGRIIFVPNNFIFTDMIANYSHAGLKTVWDGIDFMITFDSNASKAASIAKEVTKKYSKGYTEITRKQLNKLRSHYSMKNTNVEPRIYSFIEPYGIKISAWYHTNAYATLTLRSTISMEIIERLQEEDDITLAFPTQSIYVDKDVPKNRVDIETVLPKGGLY